MEYGTRRPVKDMTLGETAKVGVAEGFGIAGGLILAGVLGRQGENLVKKDVTKNSKTGDKLLAGLGNNVPKLLAWWALGKYGPEPMPGDLMSEVTNDVKKSMIGSVMYDGILRVANNGVNPAEVKIGGYKVMGGSGTGTDNKQLALRESQIRQEARNEAQRQINSAVQSVKQTTQNDMQKVVQENSYLRQQLHEALTRLTSVVKPVAQPIVQPVAQQTVPVNTIPQTHPVYVAPTETEEREKKHGFMSPADQIPVNAVSEADDRRKNFGSMPPIMDDRERKYGFMAGKNEKEVAAMFGMI